ncbi:hypothetical protein [Devosia sp. 2618]|uniref:hypothetical protein n=1 Tax=Devosia sp. 2618 TaxID=3156454 RepID=UPI003399726B
MTSDRVSDERLAEMLAGVRNHGSAKLATIYTADYEKALTELQQRRSVTVSDEMVLAGCLIIYPALFSRGFTPLPGDGPATRRTIDETIKTVTSILTAALVHAEQASVEFRYNGEGYSVAEPVAPTPGGDNRVVATMHESATETIFSKGDVPKLMGFTSSPLVPLSQLQAVERERDEAWAARNENAKLKGQRDAALARIKQMQDSNSRMAEGWSALTTRAETAEASLAALAEFVHRWTWVKEGNGTSDAERLDVLKHYPPVAALAGSDPK